MQLIIYDIIIISFYLIYNFTAYKHLYACIYSYIAKTTKQTKQTNNLIQDYSVHMYIRN